MADSAASLGSPGRGIWVGPDDHDFFEWRKSDWVTIGHDVWMGHGVPAREIKRRFSQAQAEVLQEIAVWDWSRDQYMPVEADIRVLEIDAFIERY